MELNSGATSVLKATYLNGASKAFEEYSSFARIALDSHSNVFVGGTTGSMDFPLVNPFMTEFETASFYGDMVVAGDESGSEHREIRQLLEFGSTRRSEAQDFVGLAIDNSDHLIAVGTTNSLEYPTTAGSLNRSSRLRRAPTAVQCTHFEDRSEHCCTVSMFHGCRVWTSET